MPDEVPPVSADDSRSAASQSVEQRTGLPLAGQTILITRAAEQAGVFTQQLTSLGASVLECPTIQLVAPEDTGPLDAVLGELASFSWIILTSVNGVRFFCKRVDELGIDRSVVAGVPICAVGPKTAAALSHQGIEPALIPADYRAEGVVAELARLDLAGKRILFPKADRAREVIPHELAKRGAIVECPVAYRNILPERLPEPALQALTNHLITCVVFTSSSTVTNLAALVGRDTMLSLLKDVIISSIGPITSATCRDMGLPVHVEPREYTLESLCCALVEFLS